MKVKVVERSGTSVKRTLVKSNPFKERGCKRPSCEVCALGSEIDCKAREVVYRISCGGVNGNGDLCDGVNYEGETSRSFAERFKGHMGIISNRNPSIRERSFLYDHVEKDHNGEIPPLKVQIIGKFPGDPGLRQATEAVSIRENRPPLNGKEEWTNEPRRRRENRD